MKRSQGNAATKMILIFALGFLLPLGSLAQEIQGSTFDPDTLLFAAKELMKATRYCALITLDESGHPQVRTMDPFTPEEDMVVWFGTNSYSRKVKEVRNDSRVTLYYEAPGGVGYVVIRGEAYLVNDPEIKEIYWKKEWEQFYPDQKENYLLIKVIPKKLEIVDYKHNIIGESKTWAVPSLEFESDQ